jgi:hypothetical protein
MIEMQHFINCAVPAKNERYYAYLRTFWTIDRLIWE